MPFGKSFNVVLESASDSENDAFLLLDSTADGVDVEDRVIALDASQSESKPTYLTERANGDRKSLGQVKNLLEAVINPDTFFLKKLSCTFFKMRSSANLMNTGKLFTKVVSEFSV